MINPTFASLFRKHRGQEAPEKKKGEPEEVEEQEEGPRNEAEEEGKKAKKAKKAKAEKAKAAEVVQKTDEAQKPKKAKVEKAKAAKAAEVVEQTDEEEVSQEDAEEDASETGEEHEAAAAEADEDGAGAEGPEAADEAGGGVAGQLSWLTSLPGGAASGSFAELSASMMAKQAVRTMVEDNPTNVQLSEEAAKWVGKELPIPPFWRTERMVDLERAFQSQRYDLLQRMKRLHKDASRLAERRKTGGRSK